ncbi:MULTISPECIES: thioesterase II family protein [Mycobacteriaceae]|uniref:thioesterase II family protein n=1 Tax=Mycobacteriaceae TaxID=1762 RepID=UPI0007FC4E81|nr:MULTISPECIES: alpha/beta fold hydrolase [Mycobacteriaceae]MCK0173549.1 thioesterase domain-containing protein [Mycolicibacterium sp. F2034L]OBB56117.1 thioesterase [Mycobacterium sp. 852013-51886_SCH5428379]
MTAPQVEFAPWVKRFDGAGAASTVVFPHAGGAAAAYRSLAKALSDNGVDTFIVQYPQRADRLRHPAATSITDLATELFEAGPWDRVAPLNLFGHCMGAVVAFEFARVAERHGVPVRTLWASAGQAPSTVAEAPPLPTSDRDVLADMVDLGGTDPRLLEDEDFVELLVMAVQADYRALSGYACGADDRIAADIHALRGDRDHRISREWSDRWAAHTSGEFTLTTFDGGHFYLNEHLDAVVGLLSDR